MAVYITGDIHGEVKRLVKFAKRLQLTSDDTIVILGDAGLNYFLDSRDTWRKEKLSKLPCTIFCIHGNHECRPKNLATYTLEEYFGGPVYIESNYPNIKFAKDGEVYQIPSDDGTVHSVLVCGGAYSVDKYYRLQTGNKWFSDEQPSEKTKHLVENVLESRGWIVDDIFTHTGPVSAEPVEMFLTGLDQSTVDKSTEIWLESILKRMKSFKRWWFGHYHCNKIVNNKIIILFDSFELF